MIQIPTFLITLFWVSISITLIVLIYLLTKCVLIPLWVMHSYKKQGVFCQFFLSSKGVLSRDKEYEASHKDIFGFEKELAKKNNNVPAIVTNFGSRIDITLLDPKLIKEFYNTPHYSRGFTTTVVNILMGTGLFVAEGDLWKSHRKVISSMFHFEFLKQCVPLIVDTTREFLDKVTKKDLKGVDIGNEINTITGEIVGRIFFSENLSQYDYKGQTLTLYLAGLLTRMTRLFGNSTVMFLYKAGLNLEWASAYRDFIREIKEFRQYCLKIVQDRKASGKKNNKDLLGLLLATQDASNPTEGFSDEDIISEFITFFIAGMDSTGGLITIILYLLSKNPQYIEDLEKEIKAHYNKTDPPTLDEINKMEIMHGIVREALRMYNPAPRILQRKATVDHDLLDLKIKKGMYLRPGPIYNSSNSKYFDEPEKFKPERWLNKKENEVDPFAYIPFSAGARNCIGQHLATIEAKVIVVEFLKMFKFELVPKDYDLVMTMTSIYKPKSKIIMNLEKKKLI